jgi:hypothetical protein
MTEPSTTKSDLTEKLAAGVSQRGITLSYGTTQTIGGVDLIPVAFVTYGFGGIQDSEQFGDGGGGGGVAIPLGAYAASSDGVRFRPNTTTMLALGVVAISTLGWAIKLIVKAAR